MRQERDAPCCVQHRCSDHFLTDLDRMDRSVRLNNRLDVMLPSISHPLFNFKERSFRTPSHYVPTARAHLLSELPGIAQRTCSSLEMIMKHGHVSTVVACEFRAAVNRSRDYWRLLVNALQRVYDAHLERAQMRLASIKPPRSWREIPHAGACHYRGSTCYL